MPTDCCPRCWAFEAGVCAKPDCDCHGCACGTPERPGTHGVHCLPPVEHPSEVATRLLSNRLHNFNCNMGGPVSDATCTCGAKDGRTVARAYLDLLASANEGSVKS